jgi:hypothetical protein
LKDFLRELQTQRWDDHRFYHHSRVNQSLHLLSAISFLVAYGLMFTDPFAAALIGWLVAMMSRQIGHFFFEPRSYDQINQATHQHKEDIKVGYNLHRKRILLAIWAVAPVALCFDSTLFGLLPRATGVAGALHDVGAIWLALGIGGLLFRTVHLFFLKDVATGLVWLTKILTDPFHDIKLYHRAPLLLLQGRREPMDAEGDPHSV